jgi:hypothetical protein
VGRGEDLRDRFFFCFDVLQKLRSRRLPEEISLLYPVLALSRPCFSETAEDI